MKSRLAPSGNRPPLARNPAILALLLLSTLGLRAQQTATLPPVDEKQVIQMLLLRIDSLEASEKELQDRVKKLEKGQSGNVAPTPVDPPAANQTARAEQESESLEPEKTDVNKTLLNIRGFSDFGLYGGNQKGRHTSFSLGDLNLFITSDISERFKFLTEPVFEANQDNGFEVDLERVLLEYDLNDYFKLSGGRYDTAIGYYNTAFHHTTWFQTATDRPYLFRDEEPILPVHSVYPVALENTIGTFLGEDGKVDIGRNHDLRPAAVPSLALYHPLGILEQLGPGRRCNRSCCPT